MKTIRKIKIALAANGLILMCGLAWAGPGNSETAQIFTFPLLGPVVPVDGATTKLVRTDFGVAARVQTNSIPAGDAVTIWMVVFNNPDACQFPTDLGQCSDPDIADPAVVADVMYLAGNVVGNSGKASFAGHKKIGENTGSIFVPLLPPGVEPPGLQNPTGAEIHLVVHTHGQKLPEYMPDMIKTFAGGCQDPGAPFFGLHFPEWGKQGPNTCLSLQFAVHPAD